LVLGRHDDFGLPEPRLESLEEFGKFLALEEIEHCDAGGNAQNAGNKPL